MHKNGFSLFGYLIGTAISLLIIFFTGLDAPVSVFAFITAPAFGSLIGNFIGQTKENKPAGEAVKALLFIMLVTLFGSSAISSTPALFTGNWIWFCLSITSLLITALVFRRFTNPAYVKNLWKKP